MLGFNEFTKFSEKDRHSSDFVAAYKEAQAEKLADTKEYRKKKLELMQKMIESLRASDEKK